MFHRLTPSCFQPLLTDALRGLVQTFLIQRVAKRRQSLPPFASSFRKGFREIRYFPQIMASNFWHSAFQICLQLRLDRREQIWAKMRENCAQREQHELLGITHDRIVYILRTCRLLLLLRCHRRSVSALRVLHGRGWTTSSRDAATSVTASAAIAIPPLGTVPSINGILLRTAVNLCEPAHKN
jgi:hypothetical protein